MSYVCVAATDPRTVQGGETGGIPQLQLRANIESFGYVLIRTVFILITLFADKVGRKTPLMPCSVLPSLKS